MKELSLHILDIVENSVTAGAAHVWIRIDENSETDTYTIEIRDDGQGMEKESLDRVLDPFVTKKSGKKVGMGLSLLAEAARRCGGELYVDSGLGSGTQVTATFGLTHIDRQPLGDIVSTMIVLVIGNPDVEFHFNYRRDQEKFSWSTDEIKGRLGAPSMSAPEVRDLIENSLHQGFKRLGVQTD